MKLTEHFSSSELSYSDTAIAKGIDNTPPSYVLGKMLILAMGLEQVRSLLGDNPMTISSGYRCGALNVAVGSKSTSQHILGSAADFVCPAYGDIHKIVGAIVGSGIAYDQVIAEGLKHKQWVHISFSDRNRKEALVIDDAGTRAWA